MEIEIVIEVIIDKEWQINTIMEIQKYKKKR